MINTQKWGKHRPGGDNIVLSLFSVSGWLCFLIWIFTLFIIFSGHLYRCDIHHCDPYLLPVRRPTVLKWIQQDLLYVSTVPVKRLVTLCIYMIKWNMQELHQQLLVINRFDMIAFWEQSKLQLDTEFISDCSNILITCARKYKRLDHHIFVKLLWYSGLVWVEK